MLYSYQIAEDLNRLTSPFSGIYRPMSRTGMYYGVPLDFTIEATTPGKAIVILWEYFLDNAKDPSTGNPIDIIGAMHEDEYSYWPYILSWFDSKRDLYLRAVPEGELIPPKPINREEDLVSRFQYEDLPQ